MKHRGPPTEVPNFEVIQAEFLKQVSGMVKGRVATIERKDRPRSRVIHPIGDGPMGWATSWSESHQSKHLERNPQASLAYDCTAVAPVYRDGIAEWVDAVEENLRTWDLCTTTPPPVGFDLKPQAGSIFHQNYGSLRFTPWRIEQRG